MKGVGWVQVVQDGDQPTEGDELLSSFNVATFKQDEDDAAFWNRHATPCCQSAGHKASGVDPIFVPGEAENWGNGNSMSWG